MAEFFNKKEEMLEVQLTEYGKYLLSIGQLSPVYYTFHDDEILYNAEYTRHRVQPKIKTTSINESATIHPISR